MSKKVAQVTASFYPNTGGLETHVMEISRGLLAKGWDIVVLTTDSSGKLPDEESIEGIVVKRFKSYAPGKAFFFSKGLKKYLNENSKNFDVIHAHSYHSLPALYAAETKTDNILIFTPHYHGSGHTFVRSFMHKPYKLLGKGIFKKADKIISVSAFERKLITENFNVSEDKIVLIPNGIHKADFEKVNRSDSCNRFILSVGRLEKYKGMQHLIQVLPNINADITLEIVGKGPYKEALIKLSKELGVANRVVFSQDLSRGELVQKYVDASLFCLLSDHEAYGITVAEALYAKTPCIVSNHSALVEWVDNKNCIGVNSLEDMEHLRIAISYLMGKRASNPKILDWSEVVDKISSTYELCLGQ